MVTAEGNVKVLDFGLAKSGPGGGLTPGLSATVTREGHVLGTVSHMSPEQAEGRDVDHRTDIFALGVTLFEMSTGRLPFPGKSAASVISAIIRDTPPSITDVNPRMPPELARIVRRCLTKDVDRRYQSALDVRNDLEELQQQLNTGELKATTRRSVWPWAGAAAAAALVALAVVGVLRSRETAPPPPLDGTFSALTSAPGLELFPSLSPDGRFLAFTGRVDGRWSIYLQRVEGQRPINLTADSGAEDVQPAFSPDGESIAFRSSRDGGGLFLMGATGELERRLTDFGWNPTWSPDGGEIAFATKPIFDTPYDRPARSELWAVSLEGGAPQRIGGADAVQPSWSPHGHRIAYWGLVEGGSRRDIWTIPAEGGEARPVTEDEAVDWSPVWSPDGGHLYFSSDRGGSMNLWRVAIDEVSGRVQGEPERVTAPTAFAHQPTFSADGSRLAYVSSLVEQRLLRVAFDAAAGRVVGAPETVADDLRRVAFSHVSRDGESIVFSRTHPQEDLLLSRIDGTGRRQLTDDPYRDRRPRFSPDDRRIAFYSNRGGNYEIWTIERDGTGLQRLTEDPPTPQCPLPHVVARRVTAPVQPRGCDRGDRGRGRCSRRPPGAGAARLPSGGVHLLRGGLVARRATGGGNAADPGGREVGHHRFRPGAGRLRGAHRLRAASRMDPRRAGPDLPGAPAPRHRRPRVPAGRGPAPGGRGDAEGEGAPGCARGDGDVPERFAGRAVGVLRGGLGPVGRLDAAAGRRGLSGCVLLPLPLPPLRKRSTEHAKRRTLLVSDLS